MWKTGEVDAVYCERKGDSTLTKHEYYLEELCKFQHLREIGIDTAQVVAIFQEPEWFTKTLQEKTPDLFILTESWTWYVVELKGKRSKRVKALTQIASGFLMLESVFGVRRANMQGIFVTYSPRKGYRAETITPKKEKK